MTISLDEDTRLRLPHELMVGRLVMIAFLSILLVRQLSELDQLPDDEGLLLIVALLVLTVSWIWFWWFLAAGPESSAQAVAVILVVGAATALVMLIPLGVYPFYYAVIVAGAAYRWYVGIVLVSITTVLAVVTWAAASGDSLSFQTALVTALFGGGAITVRRFVAAQLALQQTQDELKRIAAGQARMELARDLHDQLGQQLTVTVLQAELLVLDATDAAPLIRERATTLLESSRSSLKLMRETVTDLRPPQLSLELAAAETLLRAAGVRFSVERNLADLSPAVDTLLAWVVREGTTNVLRHSGARGCTVTLQHADGQCTLTIHDDGTGRGVTDPGSGLVNLSQRVANVGGTFDARPAHDGGFTVTARIPESA
ncbi:MAG: sensor histidine kinase [Candidatus Nanopelagicales bacterium]